MDMSHGYNQISLAEESQAISTFQTHQGLHRFKVLFLEASPATDLFHDRVKAALDGLPICTSIHDNILVWASTPEEHEENLDKCLTPLQEKGLTIDDDQQVIKDQYEIATKFEEYFVNIGPNLANKNTRYSSNFQVIYMDHRCSNSVFLNEIPFWDLWAKYILREL